MLSYKTYSVYTKLVTREEVYDFIQGSIFSNYKNYRSMIEHLISHKSTVCRKYKARDDKPAYNNIYAHCFKILLPKKLSTTTQHDFIKTFLQAFDVRFKTLLYLYKFNIEGTATYANIMMFTRYVFKRKSVKQARYTRDYYYTPSAKLCKKSTPGATLTHRKGDLQYDATGNVITIESYVERNEAKIFKYRSFLAFRRSISKSIIYAMLVVCRQHTIYKYIKSISYINENKLCIKKYLKHQCVTRLNYELEKVQEALLYCRIDEPHVKKAFYKLLYNLHTITHKKDSLDSVSVSYKLPFTLYKENLLYLEQHCLGLIENFILLYIAEDLS